MDENPNPAGARDPERAELTRRALLIAAADQFYDAGYHGASLAEMVAAAGVTKGAVYFHFADKRALADAVITEMTTTWAELVEQVTARGLDPLSAMLALSDQVVMHLLGDPIVRGGTRLQRDPLLRSRHNADQAARQYDFAHTTIATQLDAAAAAGLLRPSIDQTHRTEVALAIVAGITGHHLICDLTGAQVQLWHRVTAMWQHLLPSIATKRWLRGWEPHDWAHRPLPTLAGRAVDTGRVTSR